MKTAITLAFVLAIASTAGCGSTRGTNYAPLVDLRGKDATLLAADTTECQQYAKQQEGVIAQKILGDMLRGARMVPGRAEAEGELITKRCLEGRGYSVLN